MKKEMFLANLLMKMAQKETVVGIFIMAIKLKIPMVTLLK
jgi:hypothetical protein